MSISKRKKQKIFLEELVRANFNITKACEKSNITRKTYYDWINEDGKFKERLDHINEGMKDIAEEVLMEIMHDRDDPRRASVAKWFLERKARERGYAKPQEEPKEVKDTGINQQIIFITSIPRPANQQIVENEIKQIEDGSIEIIDVEENPRRKDETDTTT